MRTQIFHQTQIITMFIFNILLLASSVVALPSTHLNKRVQPFSQLDIAPWDAGRVSQYPIHSSCNATQRLQIETGLNETIQFAQHAADHVLRWQNNSEIYRKYFGDRPVYEVIGAFDIIASGDKSGVLFRCDNPDGNCALKGKSKSTSTNNTDFLGWAGHWRGENATGETVICDLSYQTRRSLSSMCSLGYNVASSPLNIFWASDLMHRLYHMPTIGGAYIEHFADDHDEVLELAASNSSESTHDSHTLQYFALEAWAYDIAVPGVGCPGAQSAVHDHASVSNTTATATTTGTPTVSQTPSSTSSLPANCHTHEGGFVHCTK